MPEPPAGAVKRAGGTSGGAFFAAILAWALGEFWAVDVPPEISAAFAGAFGVIGNVLMRRFG